MLQTYRQLTLREQEKIQAASQNLKMARESLDRQDLPGARQHLLQLLDLNPENSEAALLLAEVHADLADIEKRQNAQQYLDRAQQALADKQYGEALSLFDKAQALDPDNLETNRLRAMVLAEQVTAEQQKMRVEKIAAVQKALERGEFTTAVQQAEVGLRTFPNDPALQQLHARANQSVEAARRKKHLAEQVELARTLSEQGDVAGASRILTTLREADPHEPRVQALTQSLARLEKRLDRERLRDAELDRARALMRDNRHDEARRVLLEARDRFGRTAPLQGLLNFLAKEVKRLEEEAKVQDILREAAELIQADAPEKATKLLGKAARKYNKPVISEELNRASKLTRETEERHKFLERATVLVKKKLWAQAISLLGEAPETYRQLPRYQEL